MEKAEIDHYDFLIVGSGFAGSIMGMALANSGFKICLIEKDKHPRFTIGESSTPIADMVLRDLANRYNLPFLKRLSRYGEWQKSYPEVVCGLKRGFSYYPHQKEKKFSSTRDHKNELLVAASMDDENSDTNWLRSDVDHFLVKQAVKLGINYIDQAEIVRVIRSDNNDQWLVDYLRNNATDSITCEWIIDATGSPAFSGKFFGTTSSAVDFETNSTAVYSHFENTGKWSDYLENHSFYTADYPYNPDHSALHHLIDEGWIWMLRFNNHLLSAGILIDNNSDKIDGSAEEIWYSVIKKYPSIYALFGDSRLASNPGKIIQSRRLQRKLNKTFGDGWVALNHTAGFVDPLHSTGIAHTLTGVEKLLDLFTSNRKESFIYKMLKQFQEETFKELEIIDLMVSSGYLTRNYFDLFAASVMLYFIASIRYEQKRLRGEIPNTFLCAGEPEIQQLMSDTHHEIRTLSRVKPTKEQIIDETEKIRARIKPYNNAGLMEAVNNNIYTHTAVSLV